MGGCDPTEKTRRVFLWNRKRLSKPSDGNFVANAEREGRAAMQMKRSEVDGSLRYKTSNVLEKTPGGRRPPWFVPRPSFQGNG